MADQIFHLVQPYHLKLLNIEIAKNFPHAVKFHKQGIKQRILRMKLIIHLTQTIQGHDQIIQLIVSG